LSPIVMTQTFQIQEFWNILNNLTSLYWIQAIPFITHWKRSFWAITNLSTELKECLRKPEEAERKVSEVEVWRHFLWIIRGFNCDDSGDIETIQRALNIIRSKPSFGIRNWLEQRRMIQ
jgi:hypothetical protein